MTSRRTATASAPRVPMLLAAVIAQMRAVESMVMQQVCTQTWDGPRFASARGRAVAQPSMKVGSITSIDEFDEALDAKPKIKVVKFVADNCRGCIAMRPKFDVISRKYADQAEFYEARLADAGKVFSREAVKRTPTVLYYCGDVGRVGGFTFGPTPARGTNLRREFEMVLSRVDLLQDLTPASLLPALRYTALVGALRALVSASERLEEDYKSRGVDYDSVCKGGALARTRVEAAQEFAARRIAAQPKRAQEAAALFSWLDTGGHGALGMPELHQMVDALGGMKRFSTRLGHAHGGSTGLPEDPDELLQRLDGALQLPGHNGMLTLASFTDIMLLHQRHEQSQRTPDATPRAAYALLDTANDGAVPTEEAAGDIACIFEHIPSNAAAQEVMRDQAAIGAMLRTFDYEEKGHVSFECFARVVMRSSPSPFSPA